MAEAFPALTTIDSVNISLEIAYRELIVLDLTEGLSSDQQEGVDILRNCLSVLRRVLEANEFVTDGYNMQVTSDGMIGRPRITIPEHSLINLLENNFTVHQMGLWEFQ